MSQPNQIVIEWEFPQPRTGIAGAFDRFIGPGATNAEAILQMAAPNGLFGAAWHVFVNGYLLLPIRGFEWFMPAFFLKLLVSHLLLESPYKAESHRTLRATVPAALEMPSCFPCLLGAFA